VGSNLQCLLQVELDTAAQILYERMKALGKGVPELITCLRTSIFPLICRLASLTPPGMCKGVMLVLFVQEEIDTAAQILYERMKALGKGVPELVILPVYSNLPSEMQTKIFDPAPPGTRKCVIATNIAEASLTIDGIYYVVDPGFAKQKVKHFWQSKLNFADVIL